MSIPHLRDLKEASRTLRYFIKREDEFFTTGGRRFEDFKEAVSLLEIGDHVYVVRSTHGIRFAHHGIVIAKEKEDLKIVHFAPIRTGMVWTSRVRTDSLRAFLGENDENVRRLGLKYYANTKRVGVPGDTSRIMYYANRSLSPAQVVENVLRMRFGKVGHETTYSVFNRNCEHLAVSCKIGNDRAGSAQIDHFIQSLAFFENMIRKRITENNLTPRRVLNFVKNRDFLLLQDVLGFGNSVENEEFSLASREFVQAVRETLNEIDEEILNSVTSFERVSSLGDRCLRWCLRVLSLPLCWQKREICWKEHEDGDEEEEEEEMSLFQRLTIQFRRFLREDQVSIDSKLIQTLNHIKQFRIENLCLKIEGVAYSKWYEYGLLLARKFQDIKEMKERKRA